MTAHASLSILGGVLIFAAALWLALKGTSGRAIVTGLPVWSLALLLLAQVCYLGLDAFRYHIVLPSVTHAVPLARWIGVFSIGRLMNSALPQAGTAYRALYLRRNHDIGVTSYLAPMLGLTWLGSALAVFGIGVALVMSGRVAVVSYAYIAIGGTGVGLIFVAAWLLRRGPSSVSGNRRNNRVKSLIADASEGLRSVARRKIGLRVLALSVLVQVVGVLIWALSLHVIGVQDAIVAGTIFYLATTASTFVTVTPGGLGIVEVVSAVVGHLLLEDFAPGVLGAVVVRLTGLAAGALMAAVFGWNLGRKVVTIRDLGLSESSREDDD